jgi:hypothetical protein
MPVPVWIHLIWMSLTTAVGTWSGYLGLIRATLKGGKSPLPGRYTLRSHKWTGVVFYAMLYTGILYGMIMVDFILGTETVGLWWWHKMLAYAIGVIYFPAMLLGLDLLSRPAGVYRARPILHMLINFTACTLITVQFAMAIYASGWLN